MRFCRSILAVAAMGCLSLFACQQASSPSELVAFCFSDDEFGRELFASFRDLFERYQMESRYGLRLQFHRLDQYDPLSQPKQIEALASLRPRFVVAPSHDTAKPILDNFSRMPQSTLVFASRPSFERAGLVAPDGSRFPRTVGTLILGSGDDARRTSLAIEWLGTLSKVAVLFDRGMDSAGREEVLRQVGSRSAAQILSYEANEPGEFARVVATMARDAVQAVLVPDNDRAYVNMAEFGAAAIAANLPVVAPDAEFCRHIPGVCYWTNNANDAAEWLDNIVQAMTGIAVERIPISEPAVGQLTIAVGAAAHIGYPVPRSMISRSWRSAADAERWRSRYADAAQRSSRL